MLRDSAAADVRPRPRAMSLTMMIMRKSIHEFPFYIYMSIGFRYKNTTRKKFVHIALNSVNQCTKTSRQTEKGNFTQRNSLIPAIKFIYFT